MSRKLNFKKYPKDLSIDLFDLKSRNEMVLHEKLFYKFSKFKKFEKNNKILHRSPCCNSKKIKFLKKIKKNNYFLCNCNSIFINPVPSKQFLDRIYSDIGAYTKVRKFFFSNKKAINLRKKITKKKYDQINFFLKKKNNLKILDFGSGNTDFVNLFKNKNNHKFTFDINYNKNEKINIWDELRDNYFDIITLWGVIEHLDNPIVTLKKLLKKLKVGGILAIEAPSSDSLLSMAIFYSKKSYTPFRFLEPYRHLTFFSKLFFDNFAHKNKLDILKLHTTGLDLQTILNSKDNEFNSHILNIQKIINESGLADHYKVFFQKKIK